MSQQLLLKLS